VRWKILVEALCSAAEWRDAIIIYSNFIFTQTIITKYYNCTFLFFFHLCIM
jgi:hypothetical protein